MKLISSESSINLIQMLAEYLNAHKQLISLKKISTV